MATQRKPARTVAPGKIISQELAARDWTQRDLAAIMGRPYQAVNQILRGKKRITPETARELAQAFGTSPELWMNLETNYRLQIAEQDEKEKMIALRSRLYSTSEAVRLIREGKIKAYDTVEELEKQVAEYNTE